MIKTILTTLALVTLSAPAMAQMAPRALVLCDLGDSVELMTNRQCNRLSVPSEDIQSAVDLIKAQIR